MATSDPTEKSIMPTTSNDEPNRKASMVPLGIGETVRLRNETIRTIGRTAASASYSL